jgi:plastocyanin
MRYAPVIPTALSIGALVVAGCGGGGDGSSTAPATSRAPTTPSGAGPVAVTMKDIAFTPQSVTVRVGQQIDWTNDDDTDHNVIATSGASFRSSDFGQGGTFSYRPTRAGTIDYVCTIHPGMTGTIVVTR